MEQNSSYLLISAQVSSNYSLTVQRVECIKLDDNSNCSQLLTEYSLSNNDQAARIGFDGLQPEGYYQFTVTANHIASPGVTASGTLSACIG